MSDRHRSGLAAAAAVILLSLNLRTLFASLPPLLEDVRADLGLSATASGLLTTGPVLCLGVVAPLAPWLARRTAVERILWLWGPAAGCLGARGGGGGVRAALGPPLPAAAGGGVGR